MFCHDIMKNILCTFNVISDILMNFFLKRPRVCVNALNKQFKNLGMII